MLTLNSCLLWFKPLPSRRKRIPEVWFFQQNCFEVWQLQEDKYEQVSHSLLLPHLNLELLAEYVIKPDHLDALIEYRQRIRSVL